MINTNLQTRNKRDWITGYFAFFILHLLSLVFLSRKIFQSPNTWQACGDWVTMANSFPLTSLIFLPPRLRIALGEDKIHCKSSVALLIIHHCHCNSNKLALNSWFPLVLSQFRIDRAAEERQKSGQLLDDIWQIEGTFRGGDFEDVKRIGCEQCPRLPCLPAVHSYGG